MTTATTENPTTTTTEIKKPRAKKAKIKKSALPKKVGYFIHYVPDMTKAAEFFKTIGLKATFESPEWTEFNAGIKFALHGMCCGEKSETTTTEPKAYTPVRTNITFNVKNCDETIATFKALNVECTEPKMVCEEGRAFDFKDPFGNTFSCYGK